MGCRRELAAGWLEESAVRRSFDEVEWLCLLVPDKLSRRPLFAPAIECQMSAHVRAAVSDPSSAGDK